MGFVKCIILHLFNGFMQFSWPAAPPPTAPEQWSPVSGSGAVTWPASGGWGGGWLVAAGCTVLLYTLSALLLPNLVYQHQTQATISSSSGLDTAFHHPQWLNYWISEPVIVVNVTTDGPMWSIRLMIDCSTVTWRPYFTFY